MTVQKNLTQRHEFVGEILYHYSFLRENQNSDKLQAKKTWFRRRHHLSKTTSSNASGFLSKELPRIIKITDSSTKTRHNQHCLLVLVLSVYLFRSKEYHKTMLRGVEVNGYKLLPPPRVSLNSNNISNVCKDLLTSYQTSDGKPYAPLQSHSGKFYSIMHDIIHKFSNVSK